MKQANEAKPEGFKVSIASERLWNNFHYLSSSTSSHCRTSPRDSIVVFGSSATWKNDKSSHNKSTKKLTWCHLRTAPQFYCFSPCFTCHNRAEIELSIIYFPTKINFPLSPTQSRHTRNKGSEDLFQSWSLTFFNFINFSLRSAA